MSYKEDRQDYRIKELERKLAGMQRQLGVVHACAEASNNKTERRLRDLEIKVAAQRGVPQIKLADIYELSPGRISQIVKRVA